MLTMILRSLNRIFTYHFRVPGWPQAATVAANRFLPKLSMPVSCQMNEGHKLYLSPRLGEMYYYLGDYEPGTLHVMKHCLRPGDVFIDIGSSIGHMTFFAHKLVGSNGKVLAFEPHPKRFADLVEGIKLNGAQNVTAYAHALGSTHETRDLFVDSAGYAIAPSLLSNKSSTYAIEVKIETLDEVLNNENISNVKMMKIDVEGFELDVLHGARHLLEMGDAPIICIEVNPKSDNAYDALNFLKEINKYQLYKLRMTKRYVSKLHEYTPNRKMYAHDNIFCFLQHHFCEIDQSIFSKLPQ